MSCCGQCGGESHVQADKPVENTNEEQATATQSQATEKSEE